MTAATLLQSILGMQISQVWRGHGSAIFLDFGPLSRRKTKKPRPLALEGDATLMIEWSWRIEQPRSILCSSWSDERQWNKAFAQILNATVSRVECFGNLSKISISLSNGLRVVSLMTAEGQPSWALILKQLHAKSVDVSRGRLVVEPISAA